MLLNFGKKEIKGKDSKGLPLEDQAQANLAMEEKCNQLWTRS